MQKATQSLNEHGSAYQCNLRSSKIDLHSSLCSCIVLGSCKLWKR